jgi:hypothetical protein
MFAADAVIYHRDLWRMNSSSREREGVQPGYPEQRGWSQSRVAVKAVQQGVAMVGVAA